MDTAAARAATFRFWLLYTPVWGLVAGAVMVTGLAERWGDPELLALAVGLAVPAVVGPIVRSPQRALPWHRRTATRLAAAVAAFALLMNWSQTPFFFDVLHMRYGFRVTWTLQDNPLFLYLLTIPYFATYCALGCLAVEALGARTAGWGRVARVVAVAPVAPALAFLETAMNANPFMERLFCYDDAGYALGFGTVVYGGTIAVNLAVWSRIDARGPTPWRTLALWVAAGMYVIVLWLDVARFGVAPHLTAVGRDATPSCLAP